MYKVHLKTQCLRKVCGIKCSFYLGDECTRMLRTVLCPLRIGRRWLPLSLAQRNVVVHK